jgi:hypothetical protein
MNFQFTEEHFSVQQAARDFAKNELLPGVIERDTHQKFPLEQVKKMGQLGFMGMMVDPKYNGGGMDTIAYVLAMEEISKIDASDSRDLAQKNKSRNTSPGLHPANLLAHSVFRSRKQVPTPLVSGQSPRIKEIIIY